MNEFELIDEIVATLGAAASGPLVRVGPGDDAAVTRVPPGMELISSIDALVGDVHFPAAAGPALIGYRAIMVSVSDLAAMGAEQGFVLVALNLPTDDPAWVRELTVGMREAAETLGVGLVGGNIARGPLAIAVSVHGFAPAGQALLRSGARPGDRIYVTGELGGAAAALARGGLADCRAADQLDPLARRYFRPRARLPEGIALRGRAHSAIDLSDGLLQDLGHILKASRVGARLDAAAIPVAEGATLEQALHGGDDYELCFTLAGALPPLGVPVYCIGEIVAESGLTINGKPVVTSGYQHFG
ncbi:MAG: thiamine-phosphate kinase [Pseudomonadales bacterium]|nr:thiamine-phosphate kinase [Pseudomonadales bacterium]